MNFEARQKQVLRCWCVDNGLDPKKDMWPIICAINGRGCRKEVHADAQGEHGPIAVHRRGLKLAEGERVCDVWLKNKNRWHDLLYYQYNCLKELERFNIGNVCNDFKARQEACIGRWCVDNDLSKTQTTPIVCAINGWDSDERPDVNARSLIDEHRQCLGVGLLTDEWIRSVDSTCTIQWVCSAYASSMYALH